MEIRHFAYYPETSWSISEFPPLDSERTLLMVFAGSGYYDDPGPIEELLRNYPSSCAIGCSTSGEIFGTEIQDNSLVVAVIHFEDTEIDVTSTPVESASDSFNAGTSIGRTLRKPDLKSVFVLSDGINVNGSELVRGLNEALPSSVIVTGGLAGDGDRFERTWVIVEDQLRTNQVSAVGLYGDRVKIGHGSKGGWDIFGPERTVTKSDANILYEVDNKPALELYKRYLGELAVDLPASALLFPLALRKDTSIEKRVVRTVLSIDEDAQSMIFAGDIPQGYLAQLMKANFDRLVDGSSQAAIMTKSGTPEKYGETLAVAISCVGRRLVLGGRIEEELEAAMDQYPRGTRQIGFYSYGEISPFDSGPCDLHNQTMTITTISEG